MNFIIREGILGDYEEISNLVSEVHNLHYKNRPDVYIDTNTPFPKENFEAILNKDNTRVFVVENNSNKEIVAYSILQIHSTNSIQILVPTTFVYIDDFCVKSSCQRGGIGKIMMEHIINYAKKVGEASIQLNVWDFNENAINFYKKLGMRTRNRRMELKI